MQTKVLKLGFLVPSKLRTEICDLDSEQLHFLGTQICDPDFKTVWFLSP